MTTPQQAALAAIARHFDATWEAPDGDWPDGYLLLGGERIAVDVAVIGQQGECATPRPRFRFDRVALRLVGALQAALSAFVPDGAAVILTVTAPIRLPARTAAAVETTIRDWLTASPADEDVAETIHGNRIRARLVRGVSGRLRKFVGLVHNPDPDPDVVLCLTESVLQSISAIADRRPPGEFPGNPWMVVADEWGMLSVEAYRHIYAQIAPTTGPAWKMMVLADGRVEPLIG